MSTLQSWQSPEANRCRLFLPYHVIQEQKLNLYCSILVEGEIKELHSQEGITSAQLTVLKTHWGVCWNYDT